MANKTAIVYANIVGNNTKIEVNIVAIRNTNKSIYNTKRAYTNILANYKCYTDKTKSIK